jgi:anthranilate phosphoribosyltransferase
MGPMYLTRMLKELGKESPAPEFTELEAEALAGAMLDGAMEGLELGALLALLEHRPPATAELLGYSVALAQRCGRLRPPSSPVRPVVFACCHGVREVPHLLPLVALALHRLGVPVLVHGALDGGGGVAAAYVFRDLGILPCASLTQAQARLDDAGLAFVPTAALAPGLAGLVALKGRLGFGGFAQSLARLLQPFQGEALHVVATGSAAENSPLRDFLLASGPRALLLEGTEGEAFADPRRRPRLEYLAVGECQVLFDAESGAAKYPATLPAVVGAHATADWIRRALAGEVPVPSPLVNQIACCLYGAGYADDINQAKAIVAVETGGLAAA